MDSDSSPNQASESSKSPSNQQSQDHDSENRENPEEIPQQIPDNEQSNAGSVDDHGILVLSSFFEFRTFRGN